MKGKPTDKKKAMAALAMREIEDKSSTEIGKALNLPSSTVREILSGDFPRWAKLRDDAEYKRFKEETQRTLELAWHELAKDSLVQAQTKVATASYAQAMMGAGIATDKLRLLRGESTSNVAVHEIHEYRGLDALAEKLSQALIQKRQEREIEVKPERPGRK